MISITLPTIEVNVDHSNQLYLDEPADTIMPDLEASTSVIDLWSNQHKIQMIQDEVQQEILNRQRMKSKFKQTIDYQDTEMLFLQPKRGEVNRLKLQPLPQMPLKVFSFRELSPLQASKVNQMEIKASYPRLADACTSPLRNTENSRSNAAEEIQTQNSIKSESVTIPAEFPIIIDKSNGGRDNKLEAANCMGFEIYNSPK